MIVRDEEIDLKKQEEIHSVVADVIDPIDVVAEENVDNIDSIENIIPIVHTYVNDEIVVETEMAFPPVGQVNDTMNHAVLNNRDMPNQHPIGAITGLRDELNSIKSLKTVYSNKIGYANYYLWNDENQGKDDRVGFFVSLLQSENEVCIYDGTINVFGVVVSDAALIGGQDDIARDYRYALVSCSGEVHVLCESDVSVGDTVMPNEHGVAQKTDSGYGYEVAEITHDGTATYATIILGISANQFDALGQDVKDVNHRLEVDEANITSAINTANAAHRAVQELDVVVVQNTEKVNYAVDVAEDAARTAGDFEQQVAQAQADAVLAKRIADGAVTTAIEIGQEAVDTANSALGNVNVLTEKIKPITTWTHIDPETGLEVSGAQYIVDNMGTKTEIQLVQSLTERNISSIEQSAKNFNSIVTSVDNYSLGLYSQSYGLYDKSQAKDILDDGMVYVPYNPADPLGNYEYTEHYLNDTTIYSFTQGYYYTWTDSGLAYGWIESESPSVVFSSEYVAHQDTIPYWVPIQDVSYNDTVYESDTLYRWMENKWTKVATMRDNVNNRMVSSIKQEVDNISVEVVNAAGSYAHLSDRLTNQDSNISLLTTWKNNVNTSMALIDLTADDIGASIAQVVNSVGNDGQVTAASIVASINNASSSVVISADHINLEGVTTFLKPADVGAYGTTVIDGGRVSTGAIKSMNYAHVSGTFSNDGTLIDLNNGSIRSKNFAIDSNGNAYFNGQIVSSSGNIGGWEINSSKLYKKAKNLTSDGIGMIYQTTTKVPSLWNTGDSTVAFYAGASSDDPDPRYSSSCYFGVLQDGSVYMHAAKVTGNITAESGFFHDGCVIGTNTSGVHSMKISASNTSSGLGCNGGEWRINSHQSNSFMPGYGTDVSKAYLGSEGFAYYMDGTYGYSTAVRPGVINCQGNTSNNNNAWSASMLKSDGLRFFWGGTTDLRTVSGLGTSIDSPTNPSFLKAGINVNASGATFIGSWYNNGGALIVTSSRMTKNSISVYSDEHNVLFDNLIPRTFKYNNGTSNRTHYGFILDELGDAIVTAGLTSQDCGAYCLDDLDDTNGYGGIRYEEIISLNTWQIQMAKARITELENTVSELEAIIKGE